MLYLDILQQHFALFLGQFQGLHLGNNTEEGRTLQTLKHSSYKCPFGVAPVPPAARCEPVKPDRPLAAAAVFLSLSVDPLAL